MRTYKIPGNENNRARTTPVISAAMTPNAVATAAYIKARLRRTEDKQRHALVEDVAARTVRE